MLRLAALAALAAAALYAAVSRHSTFCTSGEALGAGLSCASCVDPYAGKRVLVTGASQGIGRLMALQYCGAGAHVAVTARSADKLETLRLECLRAGAASAHAVVGDMGDASTPGAVVGSVSTALNATLDLVVINHALVPFEFFLEHRDAAALEERFLRVFDVNALSAMRLVHHALPLLERSAAPGGAQVAVVSTLGVYFAPGALAAYAASKAALRVFVQSLQTELELSRYRTRVSLVALGEVATEQLTRHFAKDRAGAEAEGVGKTMLAPMEPADAAHQIACAAHRRLREAHVPFGSAYLLSWLGVVSGAFRTQLTQVGVFADMPGLAERIAAIGPRSAAPDSGM